MVQYISLHGRPRGWFGAHHVTRGLKGASHTSSSFLSPPLNEDGDNHHKIPGVLAFWAKHSFMNPTAEFLWGGPGIWVSFMPALPHRMFVVLGSSTSRVTAEMGADKEHILSELGWRAAELTASHSGTHSSPPGSTESCQQWPFCSTNQRCGPSKKDRALKEKHSGEQMQIDQAVEFLRRCTCGQGKKEGAQPLTGVFGTLWGPN